MATNITTEMLLAEQKRLYGIMRKHYPQQVADFKLTPYERDFRYKCAETLIEMLQNIITNRPTTEKKILSKQLNQLT